MRLKYTTNQMRHIIHHDLTNYFTISKIILGLSSPHITKKYILLEGLAITTKQNPIEIGHQLSDN